MKGTKPVTVICPNCAYTMAGAGLIACPECGYTGPAEPLHDRRIRLFLLAPLFLGSMLILGVSLLVVVAIVRMIEYTPTPGLLATWLLRIAFASPAVGVMGGVAIAVKAHRLAEEPADAQKRLVVLCLLPALIGVILFAVTVLFGVGLWIWAVRQNN